LLRKRVLSAVFLVPVVLFVFYMGRIWFLLFAGVLAALGSLEYRNILLVSGVEVDPVFVPISVMVAVAGCTGHPYWFVAFLMGGSLVVLSLSLRRNAPSAMYGLAGVTYIGGLLGALSLLRMTRDGRVWALFVLLVTWATDVGAYAGGHLWGKHKLAPTISPGKTWEGAVSGILSAAFAGLVLSKPFNFWAGFSIMAGCILGVLAQLGDLTESLLKRYAGVKDSGDLIPGHGGILDRFDSLLFTGAGGLLIRTLHRMLF